MSGRFIRGLSPPVTKWGHITVMWDDDHLDQVSDEDQLREVPLPDIDVQEVMRQTQGCMSVVAGDFVVLAVIVLSMGDSLV